MKSKWDRSRSCYGRFVKCSSFVIIRRNDSVIIVNRFQFDVLFFSLQWSEFFLFCHPNDTLVSSSLGDSFQHRRSEFRMKNLRIKIEISSMNPLKVKVQIWRVCNDFQTIISRPLERQSSLFWALVTLVFVAGNSRISALFLFFQFFGCQQLVTKVALH